MFGRPTRRKDAAFTDATAA